MAVAVPVGTAVLVGVCAGVLVAVPAGVLDSVGEADGVSVGVCDGGMGVSVGVTVADAVPVGVPVGVSLGVAVGRSGAPSHPPAQEPSNWKVKLSQLASSHRVAQATLPAKSSTQNPSTAHPVHAQHCAAAFHGWRSASAATMISAASLPQAQRPPSEPEFRRIASLLPV